MNYFFLYQTLKAQFSSGAATHSPGESAFGFYTHEFHSNTTIPYSLKENSPFNIELSDSTVNKDFSYPVFHPNKMEQSDGCIILLHGLNERSWDKYFPWAYQLANYTRKTVILFPIAYHMNRSPQYWSDPRKMTPFVKQRIKQIPGTTNLSIANVALSERLSSHPERFLLSGYQAANDLLDLMAYIKAGTHPLIMKVTRIDFFAYSIGSFLSQIMFLAHKDDILAESKLFIFCGGSAFEDWQGVSKFIMDSKAFEKLHAYYNGNKNYNNMVVNSIINNTALGQSFVDMLSVKNLKRRGSYYFTSMRDRVITVVLKNDTVALVDRVKSALKGMQVDEWNFSYKYSHIMPFPVASNKLVNQVNEAFDKLMLRASLLFTT
jgi:pimeloyl-ACP methyl ester carboxylesterase